MNEQAPLSDKKWFNELEWQIMNGKKPKNLTKKLTPDQFTAIERLLDDEVKVILDYKAYLQSITIQERKR